MSVTSLPSWATDSADALTIALSLPCGTRVRNRTTDETARVVGLPDAFGLVPVEYDEAPEGIYHISAHRLEPVAAERDAAGLTEVEHLGPGKIAA